jgi:hypothetical protein
LVLSDISLCSTSPTPPDAVATFSSRFPRQRTLELVISHHAWNAPSETAFALDAAPLVRCLKLLAQISTEVLLCVGDSLEVLLGSCSAPLYLTLETGRAQSASSGPPPPVDLSAPGWAATHWELSTQDHLALLSPVGPRSLSSVCLFAWLCLSVCLSLSLHVFARSLSHSFKQILSAARNMLNRMGFMERLMGLLDASSGT